MSILDSMSSTVDSAPTSDSTSSWWSSIINGASQIYQQRLNSQTSIALATIQAHPNPPALNVPSVNTSNSSVVSALGSNWLIGIGIAVILGLVLLVRKRR